MANMQATKTPMPEQDPNVRNKNFKEVTLGYTAEMAINEAKRCLQCKKPHCVEGCPVNIHIPEFIHEVAEGNFEKAYEIITDTNSLPALSGRVCPQETQCESKCVRGNKGEPVAIGRLERFVADWYRENVNAMPKKAESNEVEKLKAQGVEVMTDMVIGKVLSIDDLFEMGFKAVFVGSGAGLPMFMHIPGESLKGVCSANEYLTRINLMKAYLEESDTPILHSKAAAIVGGGNVAMDAARCAKRMGTEKVYIVYRRGEAEMPARLEEQHHAKEEGIEFMTLTNPTEIIGGEDGRVCGMKCIKMELGEPDASGRRRPIPVEGSEFVLDVDMVIMSLGTSPNPLIRSTTPGLETNKKGGIIVDENEMSTRENVFAGGDAVTGAATVILAMGAGKKAAEAIDRKLQGK